MCNKFRLLTAGEIECRVAQSGKSSKGAWCQILIYKDARVDQKLLDEVIGPMNWKNSYEFINEQLYCTVSIWDSEKKEWISKQNVGTESNTEKEKGQASDAFKRACFNWGLGRELYTAPKDVYITLKEGEYNEKDGKIYPRIRFDVSEIGYNDERQINRLVIVDPKGEVRYTFDSSQKATAKKVATKKVVADSKPVYTADNGKTMTEGDATWETAAKSVAEGKTCNDGTPIAIWLTEFYHLPKEATTRFLARVSELTKAA